MHLLLCAPIFTNHMVLQRNKNINVWGMCRNNAQVSVSLGDTQVSVAAKDGAFHAVLPPQNAGGPYEMTVSDNFGGSISFKDVMIGEVWLAGGQSNMEWELKDCTGGLAEIENAEKTANEADIRFYYTKKNAYINERFFLDERDNSWSTLNNKDAMRAWSAVGYFFAKKLAAELGCAVGIIGCNWGGTSASAWLSRRMLETDTDTKTYVDEYDNAINTKSFDEYLAEREEYFNYLAVWEPKIGEFYAKNPKGTWKEAQEYAGESRYPEPLGPLSPFRPYGLYETMLKRCCPYSLAGFIYYQGESDDHKPNAYYKLMKKLIEQWRTDWNDDTLPFLFVQLTSFGIEDDTGNCRWPLIREAQARVHKTTANTGLAVILDCGEYGDIHPKDKKTVGDRLSLQALYHVYKKIDAPDSYGLFYKTHIREGSRVKISFDYSASGFEVKGGEIKGFEVAGADKEFFAASAEISGENIIVYSDKVKIPEYVRYCWANYCDVTVFSKKTGIPLAPFRA
ncbi:MAG: sialate O-acetylesterase [Clostridiales bacterium]|nr:sialate O-acetylesterase [Clostridiales bacterium]